MKKSDKEKILNELFDREQFEGLMIIGRDKWHQLVEEVVVKMRPPTSKAKGNKHNEYVAAWFDYFRRAYGLTPHFGPAQASALRQIRLYLEKQSDSPEQALATWQAILSNYHKLEDFFKLNADLKFINSQLNKIIIQLKHVTGKAAKGHNASDLRGQL